MTLLLDSYSHPCITTKIHPKLKYAIFKVENLIIEEPSIQLKVHFKRSSQAKYAKYPLQ